MPRHEERRVLPYALPLLYEVVGRVKQYPEFLPWCAAARIVSGNPDPWHGPQMLAELVIRYKIVQESYVSRVTFTPPEGEPLQARVEAVLERGPFTHLVNDWKLRAVDERHTEVDFLVEFGFSSRVTEKLLSPVFSMIAGRMSQAFEARAKMLNERGFSVPASG